MDLISIILTVIQDAPEIVASVKAALTKQGYTNDQIDAIFAGVVPYEQLGIDPNHPVAQEGGSGGTGPVPPIGTTPAAIVNPNVHVAARTPEQAAALAPAPTTSQPDAALHVAARTPEQAAALKAGLT